MYTLYSYGDLPGDYIANWKRFAWDMYWPWSIQFRSHTQLCVILNNNLLPNKTLHYTSLILRILFIPLMWPGYEALHLHIVILNCNISSVDIVPAYTWRAPLQLSRPVPPQLVLPMPATVAEALQWVHLWTAAPAPTLEGGRREGGSGVQGKVAKETRNKATLMLIITDTPTWYLCESSFVAKQDGGCIQGLL